MNIKVKDMYKKIGIVVLSIVVLMLLPVIYCVLWTPAMTGRSTEANKALKVAERNRMPNNDFTYASNMPVRDRTDYTHSTYHPHTCINTATSFYDKHHTCSYCNHFIAHPEKWGFKETNSPKPGDLIIFFRKANDARHCGMYVGKSLLGPMMDHSDGGYQWFDYQRHIPVKFFIDISVLYSRYKYYTYVGN
jgi:hypothetical protein